jgi:eukaryotic-like serine/threonine-protein kinase
VQANGVEFLEQRRQVLATNEANWRSLSELAISMANASGQVPGSAAVRRDVPGVSTLSGTLLSSLGAQRAPDETVRSKADRLRRFVPWTVAAGALFVTGTVCGLLASRQGGRPAMVAAHGVESPLPSPPAAGPPPIALSVAASDPIVAKAVESLPVYMPPPGSRASVAVRGAAAEAPSAGTTAQPQATTARKNDCDPPFFFQGRKKIFKASCL